MNIKLEAEVKYDLVVIGTGTAGTTVAQAVRSKGWDVAIVDYLPFGGTCALRGCEPKKVLVEAAKVVDANTKHKDKGIFIPEKLSIRWSDLIQFKKTFTDPFVIQRENEYLKDGIHTFHGNAEFEGPNKIKMVGLSAGMANSVEIESETMIHGRKIVIATGAKPVDLMIQGSQFIITSDQFPSYDRNDLPDRIVFIGGGFISFEFAHVAARAGVKEITIIHRGPTPLNDFDPDLVKLLLQKCKELGINVMLNTTLKSVEKSNVGDKNYELLARLNNLYPSGIEGGERLSKSGNFG